MSGSSQPRENGALPQAVMDYSTVAVLGRVAREALVDSRLRRVIGLPTGEVILSFDRFRTDKDGADFDSWLFSADPVLFRVHPWLNELPQRSEPSHIVEVVSHHLGGARVADVDVGPFERVLTLSFVRRDYSGEETSYRFMAELMGKHSNLVLVGADDTILTSWKPVHSYQSRVREVRAGKPYRPPPAQDRITPREFTPDEWRDFLASAGALDPLDDHLARTFRGMSLTWARAICDRAGISVETPVEELSVAGRERLMGTFLETLDVVSRGEPLTGESREDFTLRVAAGFTARAEKAALEKARRELERVINRRRKKLASLEEALAKDLDKAERADEYKKRADLLLANMHLVVPGMSEIEVEDWEGDGARVRLPLERHLTPQLQVERYYRRYRKLKRMRDVAQERRNAVAAELEELQALAEALTAASAIADINRVREQCMLHGLIAVPSPWRLRRQGKRGRRGSADTGVPPGGRVEVAAHRYRSNDGFLILAGKGDRSNDALRHISKPEDIWLHVRDIPGGHVYIVTRGREVPETTLKEAAMIAVWHSKAREGSSVPVDYTRAKHVMPIPGRPGHVRFRRERTLRVTPDGKRIEMMRFMAGDEGRPS